MRTIDLQKEKFELSQLFDTARSEPVLLLTPDGDEFILSHADEFDDEVEALRNSQSFQTFLDERMKCDIRFPLEAIEKEVEDELNNTTHI
jgi:hypothetical protein